MITTDHALILRRLPFSETSLILYAFLRDKGQVTLMARGLRARRKGGERAALGGFHTVELCYNHHQRTGMHSLRWARIERSRHGLPTDPQTVLAAQLLLEASYRLLPAENPELSLFTLLEEGLDRLELGQPPLAVTAVALTLMVRAAGIGFRLDACAGCGVETQLTFFSPRRGQAVCRSCGAPHPNRVMPLPEEIRKIMESLEWPANLSLSSRWEMMHLIELSAATLAHHAGRSLVGVDALRLLVP